MKSRVVTVDRGDVEYIALKFVCPGCAAGGPDGYDGLHILAVNSPRIIPSWTWNEDLEKPTLSPSILTDGYSRCHSFLRDGVFQFLMDSTHVLAGQNVPIPDLPDWATR